MRRALVGLLVLVCSSAAHAGERRPPAWADVPVGAIPAPPDHAAAPKAIAASEHVEGLSVEPIASRFSPPLTAPKPRRLGGVSVTGAMRRCLSPNIDFASERDPADRRSEVVELRLPAITAVRSERLAIGPDGKASLEIVDAWVDPQTLGSRQHARTLVPLARIGQGPTGEGIYAFRSGEELEVVVPVAVRSAFRSARGEIETSGCGEVRVSAGSPDPGGAALVSTALDVPGDGGTNQPGVLDVHVGVSRTTRDPAPVISVATRWHLDGPEPPAPPPMGRR